LVGNIELSGGMSLRAGFSPFAGAKLDDAASFGMVQFFFARAGVAAGLGMATGADQSDAEGYQSVAELRRFARREDEADVGKHEPQGTKELNEVTIGHVGQRFELARARAEPREGNRELGFPAFAQEIIGMGGEANGFEAPIGQAIKGADAKPAETGGISALRSLEAPIEVALRA